MSVHPTSIVHPDAKLAEGVTVGPWTQISKDVTIGARTKVGSHCVIQGPTIIGKENEIHSFSSLGSDPQDKKFEADVSSKLDIGDRNVIREYCSVNRGTKTGGGVTRIGNDNWIMAYCHIAHDCQIGSNSVFANNTTLAGHVVVGDFVTLGGFTGIHQFCQLGEGSFSAISAIIKKDVPPYVIVKGNAAKPRCINRIGLQRRGFPQDAINSLRRCYRTLYLQGNTLETAIKKIEADADNSSLVHKFLEFIIESDRGIVR